MLKASIIAHKSLNFINRNRLKQVPYPMNRKIQVLFFLMILCDFCLG